jgi:hypothetical protein
MQSIDQQAAASQTSGQPLSRNSRIQTPNICVSCQDQREPVSRISIHSRTPPAVRLGTGVNRFTPGPLVTPGPQGGSPGVRGRRRGLAGTYPRCWRSAGAAGAGLEPTTGSRLLRVWRGLQLGNGCCCHCRRRCSRWCCQTGPRRSGGPPAPRVSAREAAPPSPHSRGAAPRSGGN